MDKRALSLRHTDGLALRSLGPLPSPLHRWRFGRISGRVYESLYPPVGMVAPGSFFADVERHYGDPQFVAVELLFVGGLIASLAFLHR